MADLKKKFEAAGISLNDRPANVPRVSFSTARSQTSLPAVRKSQEAFETTSHPCIPAEDKSYFICDKFFAGVADFGVHVSSSSHVLAAAVFKKAYDMGFHRGLEFAGVSLHKRTELTSDPHFDYGGVTFDRVKPYDGTLFDDDDGPDRFCDYEYEPEDCSSDAEEMSTEFKPWDK